MLKIRSVTCHFGGRLILDQVSLDLAAGELCVLCGENGAGKSTLLDVAAGVLTPDSGSVYIGDRPIADRRARAKLGYAPAQAPMPEHLAVHEWLDLMQSLRGVARAAVDETVQVWGLDHVFGAQLKTLSLGERRRLILSTADLSSPQLLLLDEPTVGLDVLGQDLLVERLRARQAQGKSSLVATHDVDFIARLNCSTAILQQGRVNPTRLVARGSSCP